jgi:heme b synthase
MSRPAHPHTGPDPDGPPAPRLVAWEVTRACNLACAHCRAAAVTEPDPRQLTTAEGLALVRHIAAMGPDIILILTGGEPLLRPDVFDLASLGAAQGLRVVMAPNGTLITPDTGRRIRESGIERISVSLDGASAAEHDRLRGVSGAFDRALVGIGHARRAGLEIQINTTITRRNLSHLEAIQDLAQSLGAMAQHIFLLVPTGRGRDLPEEVLSPREYEDVLTWFYQRQFKVPLELKATCAPHYNRVLRQQARAEGKKVDVATFGRDAVSRGCLGGQGFVFISHTGQVQPCGYLEIDCGQVRDKDFPEIYRTSPVFLALRDRSGYAGKCGRCGYRPVCGGCRARAFEATGDFLAEEPLCLYEPGAQEVPAP